MDLALELSLTWQEFARLQYGGEVVARAGLWGRRRGAGLIEIPYEQAEELGEE